MDYLNVSSLVSDFWNLFFFPVIKFSLFLLLVRFILGKETYHECGLRLFEKMHKLSQKVKYHERFKKATSIVTAFLFFSSIYLLSIISSSIESFISISVSNNTLNFLSSETILNVWRYHPYIEDISTLQRVVDYKAQESGLGTFKILSSEGLRTMPDLLLRSLIVFVLLLFLLLILLFLIKIYKRDRIKRILMIFRTVLVLIILTSMLLGVSYLNRSYQDNYSVQAWNQYESQLLSSGAPPESDIDIVTEKYNEVNEYLDRYKHDISFSLGIGPIGVSTTYENNRFEFHIVHYHY